MNGKDATQRNENIAAREKGLLAAREFQRVVQTFHKVLGYKENYGRVLQQSLEDLGKNLKENLNNLETLNRNIAIYDQNNEKILLNLNHLERKEKKFEEQYERLLRGIGVEALEAGAQPEDENAASSRNTHGQCSRERLMSRRQGFIQHLDQNFKKLESEMLSIENLRSELNHARSEISRRKADALAKKEDLEEKGKKLLNEAGRLEKEWESTLQEERILIDEFVRITSQVEGCLELDERTDHVLFSTLAAAESPESSTAFTG